MSQAKRTSKTIAALAAACLVSVALPSVPVLAQSNAEPAIAGSASVPLKYKLRIPTIDLVAANMDEATLRDIFAGNLAPHAQALADLNAASITLPEITLDDTAANESGAPIGGSITYTDIVLANIKDGIVGSLSIGSASSQANEFIATFGQMSAKNLNLPVGLAAFGLIPPLQETGFQTVYADFSAAGGTMSGKDFDCEIGKFSADRFQTRPMKTNFSEMIALMTSLEAEKSDPSPEVLGKVLRMYADIFTAFKSTPMQFDGIDCAGTSENEPFTVKLGGITMDGYEPGTYPGIAIDGLNLQFGKDGHFDFDSFLSKPFDLSGPLEVLANAPAAIDKQWLDDNARLLIPSYAGLSFAGLSIDAPNPDSKTSRIIAGIGDFDLSLAAYLNGIPTDIKTSAHHITAELPTDSADKQLQQLMALGLKTIDFGFNFDTAWDQDTQTVALNDFSVTGADLADVKLAANFGQVSDKLFALDPQEALPAAIAIVVKNVDMNVKDAGLFDLVLASVAAEQGTKAEVMRPVLAGLAQGTIVSFLVGAAEAQDVGKAVSKFISGTAKSLSINLTAKNEPGLSFLDFVAAEDDPSQLIGKVNISATAQ